MTPEEVRDCAGGLAFQAVTACDDFVIPPGDEALIEKAASEAAKVAAMAADAGQGDPDAQVLFFQLLWPTTFAHTAGDPNNA